MYVYYYLFSYEISCALLRFVITIKQRAKYKLFCTTALLLLYTAQGNPDLYKLHFFDDIYIYVYQIQFKGLKLVSPPFQKMELKYFQLYFHT
jgi:hypothetical protein